MTAWCVTRVARTLGEHAAAWDALNQRLFNNHPMLESRFVDNLLRNFGTGREYLCVLEKHGQAEAMCLLVPKGFGVWETFLPSQAQVSPTLISKLESWKELMNSLPGFVARLDFLCIDSKFSDLSTGGYATSNRMDHALTINISLASGFDSYWASRSKNLTKNIARYERRLEANNITKKFLCINDKNDIRSAVARYAELESKGWKASIGTAISGNNTQGIFYTDLMSQFADTEMSMVCELWLDDHLAASRLLIAGEEMVIILKTTYDESYSQYAPGRLLLRDVIKAMCIQHPNKTLEFYTDANPDQIAWATEQRWISHWSHHKNRRWVGIYSVMSAVRHVLSRNTNGNLLLGKSDSVEVFSRTEDMPPDVLHLFDEAEQDNIQLGAAWFNNLINTVYQEHSGVRIYVLRRSGHPIAALPILVTNGRLGETKIESLANYYTSLYAPALAPEVKYRDLALLLNAVLKAHTPIASLQFTPMNPESRHFGRLWNAAQANGLVPFSFFCFGNWYLTGQTDWAAYLKSRDGLLRNTIKRMTKKFAADGGRLELVTGGRELERCVSAYRQVYANSWKHAEPYPSFIPGLIQTCAEHGWLRLGVAWLKGAPIAAQIWIVLNGKASIYKLAYDENYKSYGAGTQLTAMLMAHVMNEDGITEVDFLSGDDLYKQDWMSDRRERWGLIAYNPKSIAGVFSLATEIGGRTLKTLRSLIQSILITPSSDTTIKIKDRSPSTGGSNFRSTNDNSDERPLNSNERIYDESQ